VLRDECLDEPRIGGERRAVLRTGLESTPDGRSRRVTADGFTNRRGEFGGQRRFDANEWRARIAEFETNLHAVGRVRIDDDSLACGDFANRGQEGGLCASHL